MIHNHIFIKKFYKEKGIPFEGSITASAIDGFMETKQVIDETDTFAAYVRSHMKCPDCGKPMRLAKCKYSLMAERGRYGGIEVHCCGYPQHEYELDEI